MVDVVIVGGGLAGLACARALEQEGVSYVLLEAADAAGGRVRTDVEQGFRLDRGFQVLLTAYPEAQKQLDYTRLELRPFTPGAMVWRRNRFHTFADPFRRPGAALKSALDDTLTWKDKFLIAKLRAQVAGAEPGALFTGPQTDTRTYLKQYGFSEQAIDRFFAPFFGGVFLDASLRASDRFFRYLFQCFASADTTVPACGMEEIPRQMAAMLPPQRALLNTSVKSIARTGKSYTVDTVSSQPVDARAVVVATDGGTARKLASPLVGTGQIPGTGWNGTTTFYFAAEKAEIEEPILLLNGEGPSAGPVNHACWMSQVSAAYAPAGAALFCANVLGNVPSDDRERGALAAEVQAHMRRWFGAAVDKWQIVGGYSLPHALPLQRYAEWQQPVTHARGVARGRGKREESAEVYLCGDYCESASIQGALFSGRKTAEALLLNMKR